MTNSIKNSAKISTSALRDLKSTIGNSMEIKMDGGYGFNLTATGNKIWRGTYLDKYDVARGLEKKWVYFVNFKTGVIRKTGGSSKSKINF